MLLLGLCTSLGPSPWSSHSHVVLCCLRSALYVLVLPCHRLQYYHFAFRLPRIFRPLITALQIVQLFTVTWVWHITPDVCSDVTLYASFPTKYPFEYVLPYLFVPVYLLFFLHFFATNYLMSKPKPAAAKAKEQ